MRPHGKRVIGALVASFVYGIAVLAVASDLRHVPVSVTEMTVEYGCGPTPTQSPPGASPGPGCPSITEMTVRYLGSGCSYDDFVVRVRQRPTVQLVTIFKKKSASECFANGNVFTGTLESVFLTTTQIKPEKPVRVTNTIPVQSIPRP